MKYLIGCAEDFNFEWFAAHNAIDPKLKNNGECVILIELDEEEYVLLKIKGIKLTPVTAVYPKHMAGQIPETFERHIQRNNPEPLTEALYKKMLQKDDTMSELVTALVMKHLPEFLAGGIDEE